MFGSTLYLNPSQLATRDVKLMTRTHQKTIHRQSQASESKSKIHHHQPKKVVSPPPDLDTVNVASRVNEKVADAEPTKAEIEEMWKHRPPEIVKIDEARMAKMRTMYGLKTQQAREKTKPIVYEDTMILAADGSLVVSPEVKEMLHLPDPQMLKREHDRYERWKKRFPEIMAETDRQIKEQERLYEKRGLRKEYKAMVEGKRCFQDSSGTDPPIKYVGPIDEVPIKRQKVDGDSSINKDSYIDKLDNKSSTPDNTAEDDIPSPLSSVSSSSSSSTPSPSEISPYLPYNYYEAMEDVNTDVMYSFEYGIEKSQDYYNNGPSITSSDFDLSTMENDLLQSTNYTNKLTRQSQVIADARIQPLGSPCGIWEDITSDITPPPASPLQYPDTSYDFTSSDDSEDFPSTEDDNQRTVGHRGLCCSYNPLITDEIESPREPLDIPEDATDIPEEATDIPEEAPGCLRALVEYPEEACDISEATVQYSSNTADAFHSSQLPTTNEESVSREKNNIEKTVENQNVKKVLTFKEIHQKEKLTKKEWHQEVFKKLVIDLRCIREVCAREESAQATLEELNVDKQQLLNKIRAKREKMKMLKEETEQSKIIMERNQRSKRVKNRDKNKDKSLNKSLNDEGVALVNCYEQHEEIPEEKIEKERNTLDKIYIDFLASLELVPSATDGTQLNSAATTEVKMPTTTSSWRDQARHKRHREEAFEEKTPVAIKHNNENSVGTLITGDNDNHSSSSVPVQSGSSLLLGYDDDNPDEEKAEEGAIEEDSFFYLNYPKRLRRSSDDGSSTTDTSDKSDDHQNTSPLTIDPVESEIQLLKQLTTIRRVGTG